MDNENFTSRRKHPRHSLRDGARVIDMATGQSVGSIANLSLEGLMLVNSQPLDTDCIYQLSVTIDDDIVYAGKSCDITIGVDCLWSSPAVSKDVSTYWSGCQIIDISDEDLALLKQLIEELAEQDGRV
jgi:hypothetical protein